MPSSFDNGSYIVTRKINYGGESDVYLVKEMGSEIDYVVKMMRAHYQTRQLAHDALQEADKYNDLEHPHVAKLVNTFVDAMDNSFVPCMVLEYYPCGDLQKYMEQFSGNKLLPEKTVANFGRQIADGLHYVHEAKIIHADLKPANILLKTNDHCVIADFGISKRLQTHRSFGTFGGGTLTTIAPESFSGKLTSRSDIWALGVILFQMLVPVELHPTQPLFQVCDSSPDGFLPLIEKKLRDGRKDEPITEPMIELVCDTLKRDLHQRPSAEEVKQRLEAIINGTAVSMRRDPAVDLRTAIQSIKTAASKEAVIQGFTLARQAVCTPAGQQEVVTTTWVPVFSAIKDQINNCPAEALGVFVGLATGEVGLQLLLGNAALIIDLMTPLIKDAKSPVARAIAQIIGSLVAPAKGDTGNLASTARGLIVPKVLNQGNVLLEFLRNFKSDTETVLALSTAITNLCIGDPATQAKFSTKEAMGDMLSVLKEGKLEASAVTTVLEIFYMLLQDATARQNFLQGEGPGALVAVWERHAAHGPLGIQGCRILETFWGERERDSAAKKQAKEAFKDHPKLAVCLLHTLAGLAGTKTEEGAVVSVYENLAAFLHVHQENAHRELYKQGNLLTVLLTPLYEFRTNPRIVKAAAAVFAALRRIGRPVAYVLLKLVEPYAKFQNVTLSKEKYEQMITDLMFTVRIHTLNCFVEPIVKQQLDIGDFGHEKPLDVSGLINVLALAPAPTGTAKLPDYASAMLAIVDRLRCVEHFDKWTDKRFMADDRAVLIETIKGKGGRYGEAAKILEHLLKSTAK